MKRTYLYSAVSKINLSSMYEVILFLGKSMKYFKLTKMPKKSYDGLNNFDFMRQMKQVSSGIGMYTTIFTQCMTVNHAYIYFIIRCSKVRPPGNCIHN